MSRFGVIFDMDGVLVDSSEAHYAAWHELGRRHNRPFSKSLFNQTFGMHNAQIIPLWLGSVEPEHSQALAEEKEVLFRERVAGSMRALEGSVDLVRALCAEGIKVAVGSSGPRQNVELILDSLGIRACFTGLSTGDDVVHGKPDPEVFLIAAQKLGLDTSRCVVIEDAPQGIEAARAAGMAVIGVTTSRPATDLEGAVLIVESLQQLTVEQIGTLLV